MKNDRQVHFSGVLTNTNAFQTSSPIQRTRKQTGSWLWLKVLVVITVVIPVGVRVIDVIATKFF
jgi:hypothetical protein